MECRDAMPLLSKVIDGEADDAERKALEAHLAACAECRARGDRWRRNDGVLRGGLRTEAPSVGLADRIVAGTMASARPGVRWGRWVARLAAAALFLFGFTDVFIRRQIEGAPTRVEQDFVLVANAEAAAGGRSLATVQLRALTEKVGVAGSKVTLSMRPAGGGAETQVAEGTTREDGSCLLPFGLPSAEGDYEVVARVLGPKGQEEISRRVSVKRDFKLFVSTDKPLYQPGQVIHIRTLALAATDLTPAADMPILLEVFDAKENKVFKRTGNASKFGIVSADFELADEVLTGAYRVRATAGRTTSEAMIEVKRYVLPKFKVQVSPERSWYLPGETVKGTVRADYFFGKTVEEAKVELEFVTFVAGEVKVATWSGKTDASGTAAFEVALPKVFHGIDLMQGDAPLLVRANVTDAADHPQEANASLTVAQEAIRIVLVPESGRLVAGVENVLYIMTTYPDGRPAQTEVKLDGTVALAADDPPGVAVNALMVRTDETGLAWVRLTPLNVYANPITRVHAKDASGNQATLAGLPLVESLGNLDRQGGFLLRPDKAIYHAGETMKLALLAPAMPGWYYVDLVRDRRTLVTASVEVKGGAGAIEVDLPPEAFGAIEVHAYHVDPTGQIVRDTRIVLVDPPKGLLVNATLDKETYRPGEKAQIHFQVTNGAGAGVPAAIGLSIVDESLFALAETKPGLERVYAAIEEDILKPRYQIKSCPFTPATFALPEARPQGPEPRVQALATVALAAAGEDLDEGKVENSFPIRERAQQRRLQVLHSRLHDVEDFGLASLFVMAGVLVLVLFPVLVLGKLFRGLTAAIIATSLTLVILLAGVVCAPTDEFRTAAGLLFVLAWMSTMIAGIARRANRIACTLALCTVTVAGFGLLSTKVKYMFTGSVKSLDEGRVTSPSSVPDLSQAIGGDILETQNRAHSLKHMRTGEGTTAVDLGPPSKGARATEPPRLRQWFPETLFWAPQVITDDTGRATVDVPNVADSITTWRMVASAVSARGEMGGMTGGLRVFQDFFVDPDLPVALTQGDRVELPVAVYNWLAEPQTVELTLAESAGVRLLDGEPKKSVRMEGNSVGVVRFPITVERIGSWKVRVDARGSKGLADAIERTVRVLPDGKEVDFGASNRLGATARETVTIPPEAVPGASVLLVKLLPGTFAEVKDGLEKMLQLPYG